jgi:tetratricopeptide (TPR) repeat protein
MNEQQIKEWLQNTDRAAGPALFGPVSAAHLRRRVRRKRLLRLMPSAAAAVLLIGFGWWSFHSRPVVPPAPQQDRRIASLEHQVQQLQAQTERALQLVHEVLAQERQQERIAALEAELARMPDPAAEMERQVDRAAFALLYEADQLYRELNQTESAVEAYEQVIHLFPQNQWAHVARKRLAEIKQLQFNESKTEGDSKCVSPSV